MVLVLVLLVLLVLVLLLVVVLVVLVVLPLLVVVVVVVILLLLVVHAAWPSPHIESNVGQLYNMPSLDLAKLKWVRRCNRRYLRRQYCEGAKGNLCQDVCIVFQRYCRRKLPRADIRNVCSF